MARTNRPEPYEFDVDRCIELHNRIVNACVVQNPHVTVTRGYFNYYAQTNPDMESVLQNLREQFDDEEGFCAFLDGIDIPHSIPGNQISFTPEIIEVCDPGAMWSCGQGQSHVTPETGIVVLYRARDFEDGRGLMFDLDTYSAAFMESMYCDPFNQELGDEVLWLSLEDVLQVWWSRIESGKYVPISLHNPPPQIMESGEHIRGWTTVPYLPQDLDNALLVWDEYLDAIISRMPTTSALDETPSTDEFRGLLDANNVRQGFFRDFLLRARRPPTRLAFIAPGLEVPTAKSISQSMVHINNYRNRELIDPQDREAYHGESGPAVVLFPLSNNSGAEVPLHGLLLTPDENRAWEDSVAVSLPRDEPNGNIDWPCPFTVRKYNVLFQPGKCPFGYDHCVTLAALLSKWKQLIVQGIWTIGPGGVEGGREWLEQKSDPKIVENEGLGVEAICFTSS